MGLGTRLKVSVSGGGDMTGVEVSRGGSGAAVSNGLTDGRGEGFTVEVGVAFGFGNGVGVGVGDSATVTGLRDWKGVEAASCARTSAVAASNPIAKNNERMIRIRNSGDASPRASAGSRANPIAASLSLKGNARRPKSKWTERGVATKSSCLMKNPGEPNRSWR